VRVAVLSVTAAGVGLTLTAATSVMFAELHWTPGVLAQAEDRCHRIGQRNAVNVMYLVCEDPNVSVDMQLWEMLGRKVNNLGRVVDGERNSGLEATRAEDNDPSTIPKRDRQSVQDELQSFFANTANKTEKTTAPKIPAKGTILSFFAKQQQASQNSSSIRSDETAQTSTPDASVASIRGSSECDVVQWDCMKCTFINSKGRSKSGRLECKMCGTSRDNEGNREKTPTPSPNLVTPGSGFRNNTKSRIDAPRSSSSHARNDSELIVIDENHNHQYMVGPSSSRSRSQSMDVIVLDNVLKQASSPESASNTPSGSARKRQKTDPPNSRSNTSTPIEIEQKSSRKPLLLFSVSKNSGRVMIHYEKTKEPSLVSFDLEQILSRETVDHMLEAKLDRKTSGSSATVTPLDFDTPTIVKGR
jgi:hypothetical protein